MIGVAAIVAAADYGSVMDDDTSDGHLADCHGFSGLRECLLHVFLICGQHGDSLLAKKQSCIYDNNVKYLEPNRNTEIREWGRGYQRV